MTDTAPRDPGLNFETDHYIAEPQAEVRSFGFWVFLMSDLILFGCCFATFLSMDNAMGIAGGPSGAQLFSLSSVAIQTACLLLGSFAFGLGAVALKYDPTPAATVRWLGVAMALGLAFLVFEIRDLAHIWDQGGTPQRSGYWSSFTLLVGLHGAHVAGGIVWIAVMIAQLLVQGPLPPIKSRLLRLGLYWHFLDIVWIGIFTVVFLRAGMSERAKDTRLYITGLLLAAVLTAVSFGAVMLGLPRGATIWVICLAALAQVVVQFRYFLHVDVSRQKREDLQLILFTTLILIMVVGGSVWILANQAARMM